MHGDTGAAPGPAVLVRRAEPLDHVGIAVTVGVPKCHDVAARRVGPLVVVTAPCVHEDVAVRRDRDVARVAELVGKDRGAEAGGQRNPAVVGVLAGVLRSRVGLRFRSRRRCTRPAGCRSRRPARVSNSRASSTSLGQIWNCVHEPHLWVILDQPHPAPVVVAGDGTRGSNGRRVFSVAMKPLVGVAIAGLVVSAAPLSSVARLRWLSTARRITLDNSDDCVRLNEIQLLGTHNSYHVAPPPAMLAALGRAGRDIEYTHRPLTEQLSQLGIRQFELDVFADPEGGRFATPAAFRMVKGSNPSVPSCSRARLQGDPHAGRRLSHDVHDAEGVPDRRSRSWSRANPWHVPIMVMIEAKDSPLVMTRSGLGFVQACPHRRRRIPRPRRRDPIGVRRRPRHHAGSRPRRPRDARRGDGSGRMADAAGGAGKDSLRARQHGRAPRRLPARQSFARRPDAVRQLGSARTVGRVHQDERSAWRARRSASRSTSGPLPDSDARRHSRRPKREAEAPRDGTRRSARARSTSAPTIRSQVRSGRDTARLPGAERLAARCNPVNAPPGCRDEWLEPGSAATPTRPRR